MKKGRLQPKQISLNPICPSSAPCGRCAPKRSHPYGWRPGLSPQFGTQSPKLGYQTKRLQSPRPTTGWRTSPASHGNSTRAFPLSCLPRGGGQDFLCMLRWWRMHKKVPIFFSFLFFCTCQPFGFFRNSPRSVFEIFLTTQKYFLCFVKNTKSG